MVYNGGEMPIPEGMTKREERMYWGTVHRLVEQGRAMVRAVRIAAEYIRRKREMERGGE